MAINQSRIFYENLLSSTTNKLLNDLEYHKFSRSYWKACTRLHLLDTTPRRLRKEISNSKLTTASDSDIFSQSSVQCQQELRLSIIGIECIAFPCLKRHLKLKVYHARKIWSVDNWTRAVRIKSSRLISVV